MTKNAIEFFKAMIKSEEDWLEQAVNPSVEDLNIAMEIINKCNFMIEELEREC